MQKKWTEREDRELTRLVRRFGTNWVLVREYFKGQRTRDSVLKRWHGFLKLRRSKKQKGNYEDNRSATRQRRSKVEKEPPAANSRSRKQIFIKKEIPQASKIRLTRAGGPEEKRKTPKYIMRKQQLGESKRFQRLRNFLDEDGPRYRKKEKRAELKQQEEEVEVPVVVKKQVKKENIIDKPSKRWTGSDDEKLKNLVVNEGMTSWDELGKALNCNAEEIQKRWKNQIYRKIKLDNTIGGFLKYSNEEDTILVTCRRNGLSWEDIMIFLPGRSAYSIESRFRRANRSDVEVEAYTTNRHFMIREMLKKIVQNKRVEKEVLVQADN